MGPRETMHDDHSAEEPSQTNQWLIRVEMGVKEIGRKESRE